MPRAELDPDRRSRVPASCGGMYVERDFPEPLGARSGSFPVRLHGDRLVYTRDGSAEFAGGVSFEQGNRRLVGERASVREVGGTREVSFTDGFHLSEPGLALAGDSATFDVAAERVRVEDVDFVLFAPAFRGAAAAIERRDDLLTVEAATLTRCAPGVDTWRVETQSIAVRPGDAFARARNVVVKLKGVPIFYSPWLRIPVSADRQSGFLFPNAGYSGDDGADLATPFYVNLAPNYDATLTPRHVSGRGTGLTVEFRHLNGFAETAAVGAVLPQDRRYAGAGDPDIASNRWLSRVSHRGGLGGLTTFVDYAAVSDRDYFRDLGTDQDVVGQGHLRRFAEMRYARGGLSVGLSAQAFQMLDGRREPHRRVPALDLTYGGRVMGSLGWTLGASWTAFDPPEELSGGRARMSGERAHVESRLQLPFLRSWGSLKLGAGYRYTSYALEAWAADATPERAIAFADLDGSLFFDRDLGERTVWTLEPRGYYLYQSYEAQDALPLFDTSFTTFSYPRLFRRDRFSGLDRIGDANQLAMGVTSRLLDSRTGRERVRASLGRIFFFEDQRVTLRGPAAGDARSASAFAAELAARIGAFTVTGGGVWDPEHADAREFGVSLRYRSSNDRIFNLARRSRRDSNIDQGEVSAIWPLGDRWSVIGKWNYDVENARSNAIIAGFGYASCCWQARLLYRRFIEPAPGGALAEVESDEGVMVQFVLRGLAGVGGRVESLLSRGIPGYREESLAGPVPPLR